jgi:ABC-type multidrug transport system fused ATPase/permease subunit
MSSNNIYLPSDDLYSMIIKCIIWGIIGTALGIIINNLTIFIINNITILKHTNNRVVILEIVFQFILCCIILSLIHMKFNYFGWTWQNTTPGFVFVSLFFAVQYNIFNNIPHLFILDLINK